MRTASAPASYVRSRVTTGRCALVFLVVVGAGMLPATAAAQDVTPDGGSLTATANTSNNWAGFSVYNVMGFTQEIALSCFGTGSITDCSVQSSITLAPDETGGVSVSYVTGSAGTGNLVLMAEGSGGSDDGWYVVTVQNPAPPPSALVVDLTSHNADNLSPSLCVAECFDARVAYTTPAYISLDVPRSVTLAHSQAQARATGLVQVNVTDTAATPGVKMSIRLRRPDSTWVTFVTGSQEIYYASGVGPNRLAAQFDATTLATGAHEYRLHVRSWSSGGAMLREGTSLIRVLILNEKDSEFGWGWSMPGLQRVHEQADGAIVLTEGDGTIRRFALVSCPSTCSYSSPPGDFSTLTRRAAWGDGFKWDRVYIDGTAAVYRTDGRLASVRDRFNNQTTFAYSGTPARLSSITDPVGKVITFGYGADNKLDWIKDPGNRYTYVAINGVKDLTEITDPATVAALKLTYDAQHRVTRRTDRRGGLWDFAYDFAGKLKADTMPTVVIGGVNARPVIRFRSAESVVLVDAATGYGTSSNPAPRIDPSTVRAEITNARGFVTKYAVDRWGAPTRVEEPLGRVSRVWRNANRQDTLAISPRGDTVRMTWTGPNVTQIVRRPLGRTINLEYETTYNELKRVYGDADSVWNYWSSGRLDSVRVGRSADTVTKFKYDSRGRDTLITDPKGHKSRRYFASTGWQNTDSTKSETRRTAFAYDNLGRDTLQKDPQNNVWKTKYDIINRVTQRLGPAPIHDTTTFVYDSLYLRAIIDAKAQRYGFSVNALGWVVNDTNPVGVARTFAFDSNGNVISSTNRRGQTITFTYDSLDNLRSRVTPDAGTTTFVTDPLDRSVAVLNGESVDTLRFDVSGRPTSEISVRAGTRYELISTFDIRDRRTRLQVSAPEWSDSIRYRYNARSALDTLVDVSGRRTRFVYNSDGSLMEIQLPNGVNIAHGFPSTHTPSKSQYSVSAPNDAIGRHYGYDSLSRVGERLNHSATAGREFSYDAAGRLLEYRDFHMEGAGCSPVFEYDDPPPGSEPIGWDCSGGSRVVDQTVTYSYDKVGNRLDLSAIVTTGNRLAKFNGDSLIYDADGNLVRRTINGNDSQRLYWNSIGQLVAVWTLGKDSVNYAYDGSDRRVRRWIGTITRRYLHDGDDLFAEIDGSSTIFGLYAYYPGMDKPHSVRRVGSMYYYTLDVPGHVSGMLDTTGALINRFTYSPHGVLQESDVGMPSEPLRFSAREFDGETGLYFMRARYYDPTTGRFVSEDPIGLDGGINLYTYSGNDPVNGRDPEGTCPRGSVLLIDFHEDENGKVVWEANCVDEKTGGVLETLNLNTGDEFLDDRRYRLRIERAILDAPLTTAYTGRGVLIEAETFGACARGSCTVGYGTADEGRLPFWRLFDTFVYHSHPAVGGDACNCSKDARRAARGAWGMPMYVFTTRTIYRISENGHVTAYRRYKRK